MNKHRSILIILFLAMLALVVPASTQAAGRAPSKFQYKYKGLGTFTEVTGYDPSDPCIEVSTYMLVSKDSPLVGGTGPYASVYMELSATNTCTSTPLVSASGDIALPANAFVVANRLESATLHLSGEIYDYLSGGSVPVSMNLVWTATYPVVQNKYTFHNHTGSCTSVNTFQGSSRDASVSGSLTAAGVEFVANPRIVDLGYISNVKSGDLYVGCF